MFADLEWTSVAKATGISVRYHVPNRQTWDLYWIAEFENILKEQVISDAIAPSGPGSSVLKSFTRTN